MITIYEPGIMSQRTSKLVEYNGMTLGVLKTAQLRKMYRLGCLANLYSGCVVSLVVAGVAVSKCVPAMLRGVPGFPPSKAGFPRVSHQKSWRAMVSKGAAGDFWFRASVDTAWHLSRLHSGKGHPWRGVGQSLLPSKGSIQRFVYSLVREKRIGWLDPFALWLFDMFGV